MIRFNINEICGFLVRKFRLSTGPEAAPLRSAHFICEPKMNGLSAKNFADYQLPIAQISAQAVAWRFNIGGNTSGVYFLFNGDELVYVGQASSIGSRLNAHAKSKKPWNRCAWIVVDDQEIKNHLEAVYINDHYPLHNKRTEVLPKGVKRKRCEKIVVLPLSPLRLPR